MKALLLLFLFLRLFALNVCIYKVHNYVYNPKDWSSARAFCQQNWDDLSIFSKDELQGYSDNPPKTEDFFWIGLCRDPQIPGAWKWVRGQDATDLQWDVRQPNDYTQKCGLVKKTSAKLHDGDCKEHWPFYCMSVYELVLVQLESTWEEAYLYCREYHHDLAVLSSNDIMNEAKDKSRTATTDQVWIGLGFLAGNWFWVNSEGMGFKAWSSQGELSCPESNQRCGVYDVKQQVWKPADCDQRRNFLCVRKALVW